MNFFDYISDKKIIIIIVSLILNLCLIGTNIYFAYNYFNYECISCENYINVSKEDNITTENTVMHVDIKGAVKNPGVYEVTSDNIINDVIALAGGFKTNAYQNNINLSKKVQDELVIYVYTKNEYQNLNIVEKEMTECTCDNYDISDCTSNGISEIVIGTSDNNNDNTNNLININTATLEELTTLSGIGTSKAQAIIDYRSQNKFDTIEDIKKVSGIGDKAFEQIKDYITV